MVRACYILSISSLLFACVAIYVCATNRRLPDHTKCSAIERFKQTIENRTETNREKISPLVQQAKILANYLNPPAPPKPKVLASKPETKVATVPPKIEPARTSPKFELHGISYRPSNPNESMALIWQPDTGRRWVKCGTLIGHITVTTIEPNSIECLQGQDVVVMEVDPQQMAPSLKSKESIRFASAAGQTNDKTNGPVVTHVAFPSNDRGDRSNTKTRKSSHTEGSTTRRYRLGR